MKNIKLILLFTTMSLFAFTSLSVEARDCSNPEGFHEKLMCKKEQGKDLSDTSGEEKAGTLIEQKTIKSLWQKIMSIFSLNFHRIFQFFHIILEV